jgi:hypothetical protein
MGGGESPKVGHGCPAVRFVPQSPALLEPTRLKRSCAAIPLDWYYWSLVLACVGIPLILLSYTQVLWEEKERLYMRVLPVIPLYWMFVGFVATCSLFRGAKKLGKTER